MNRSSLRVGVSDGLVGRWAVGWADGRSVLRAVKRSGWASGQAVVGRSANRTGRSDGGPSVGLSVGRSVGAVECAVLGRPRNALGRPRIALGRPRTALGRPRAALGRSKTILGLRAGALPDGRTVEQIAQGSLGHTTLKCNTFIAKTGARKVRSGRWKQQRLSVLQTFTIGTCCERRTLDHQKHSSVLRGMGY